MRAKILALLALVIVSGCLPKRGELHSLPEQSIETSAEITVMRNNNFVGSAIRYYPTVNGKRIAGLYTKEHIIFQLPEGNYRLGVEGAIYGSGPLFKDEVEKHLQAKEQYFFLLSPKLPYFGKGMEIKETDSEGASQRLVDSTFISIGEVSESPGTVQKIIVAPLEIFGLSE